MIKLFKTSALCLAALSMCITFTACNGDENNANPSTKIIAANGYNLQSITKGNKTVTFSYDAQGLITSATTINGNKTRQTLYTYGENTIEAVRSNNGVTCERFVYTLTDGLITALNVYEADNSLDCTEVYTYVGNCLVGCTETDDDGDIESETFTWTTGDLTQYQEDNDDIINYLYGTETSSDLIELWAITEYDPVMVLQGFFGNGPQHRLSGMTLIDDDDTMSVNISYLYDENGNVTAMNTACGNNTAKGHGNGHGNGDCDGNGSGQGNGNGTGDCDGTGNGHGDCDGNGHGHGDCDDDYCDGYGNGRTITFVWE